MQRAVQRSPLYPLKLDNTFLRGVWGCRGGVVGGGSKVFVEKAPSNGRHNCVTSTRGRMVTHSLAEFLGRRFECARAVQLFGRLAVLETHALRS